MWRNKLCHGSCIMKLKHIFSTIVSIVFLSANLNAQEGKDPYMKKDAAKPVKKKEMAKSNVLSVTFELFSIPTVEAGKLMRERDSDHAKIRLSSGEWKSGIDDCLTHTVRSEIY